MKHRRGAVMHVVTVQWFKCYDREDLGGQDIDFFPFGFSLQNVR